MSTPTPANSPTIVAVSVGNSRVQIGRFEDGSLTASKRLNNKDLTSVVEQIVGEWRMIESRPRAAIVLASVNEELADRLASTVEDQLAIEVYRVGDDLPIPIGQQLDPETLTGADRLLNAAAAFDTLKQACIIVDAGTAVTVDFVDGEGTFHGGAIAPGASMQLRALHQNTAALPEIEFRAPDRDEAFGRNTAQAMLQGVFHGIRGMVWKLVEQYAERYGAFPTVIATGGDAATIFEDDELIDRIVPDLTLLGIAAAARHVLGDESEAESRQNS